MRGPRLRDLGPPQRHGCEFTRLTPLFPSSPRQPILTRYFPQNASKNAGEMISKYQILFNRTRQAVITGELVEIITGATASEDM